MATIERIELPAKFSDTRRAIVAALAAGDSATIDGIFGAFDRAARTAIERGDRRVLAGMRSDAERFVRVLSKYGGDDPSLETRTAVLGTVARYLESAYLAAVAADAPANEIETPEQFRGRSTGTVRDRVLAYIATHPGARPQDLVEILGIDKRQITRALRQLESKQRIVAVEPEAEDGRAIAYAPVAVA